MIESKRCDVLYDDTNNVLSHTKDRVFQLAKLIPPRDFDLNQWQWIHTSTSPIVLEIGAGKGMHAITFAKQNPHTKIIAVERTANKFVAFAKSTSQHIQQPLNNLYAVHADVIAWSVFALPPSCISQVFILYPNPERNNANQQWLNMPFFEFLLSRLKPNGTITLASNILPYIDNAQAQSLQTWQLPTIRERVINNSKRTHFETKYLARGEVCEQLIITKPAGYTTRFDNIVNKRPL